MGFSWVFLCFFKLTSCKNSRTVYHHPWLSTNLRFVLACFPTGQVLELLQSAVVEGWDCREWLTLNGYSSCWGILGQKCQVRLDSNWISASVGFPMDEQFSFALVTFEQKWPRIWVDDDRCTYIFKGFRWWDMAMACVSCYLPGGVLEAYFLLVHRWSQ